MQISQNVFYFLFSYLNSLIGPEFVEADANMSKKETKKSLKSKKSLQEWVLQLVNLLSVCITNV